MAKEQVIGQRLLRPDALAKVTGHARFPGDLYPTNTLYAKVVFSERAHARLLRIDSSEAEQVPGVVAVLTHKDVPVNEYGLIFKDQPALCSDKVRTVFDRVALVVAETQRAARKGRDAVRVQYEDLPVVVEPS